MKGSQCQLWFVREFVRSKDPIMCSSWDVNGIYHGYIWPSKLFIFKFLMCLSFAICHKYSAINSDQSFSLRQILFDKTLTKPDHSDFSYTSTLVIWAAQIVKWDHNESHLVSYEETHEQSPYERNPTWIWSINLNVSLHTKTVLASSILELVPTLKLPATRGCNLFVNSGLSRRVVLYCDFGVFLRICKFVKMTLIYFTKILSLLWWRRLESTGFTHSFTYLEFAIKFISWNYYYYWEDFFRVWITWKCVTGRMGESLMGYGTIAHYSIPIHTHY